MIPKLQDKNTSGLVAGQQVQLLFEQSIGSGAKPAASFAPEKQQMRLESLPVPPEPSALVVGAHGEVQFESAQANSAAASLIVEQVIDSRQHPRLLLLNSSGAPVQVNGLPAPNPAVLQEKDTFQFHGDVLFHVSIFNRPLIAPPRADRLGTECPVCRVPLTADAVCYTCPCGVAMHCDSTPAGLQCAQLRVECPCCSRRVNLKAGFTYWPEDDHD